MSQQFSKENLIFALNWLSNTNAYRIGDDNEQSAATDRIEDCITAFVDAGYFPNGWKLIWGPVPYTEDNSDPKTYVTDNLLYVASGPNPESPDQTLYVVANSGTNPISKFGWFQEDFNVESVINWYQPALNADNISDAITQAQSQSAVNGGVARGSFEGLYILWQMRAKPNGGTTTMNVADLLSSELEGKTSNEVEIAVVGHSLGGGLAPLLALAIVDSDDKIANLVSTYPTAGPSVGNADWKTYFFSKLSSRYFPVFNERDAVPRGWTESKMMDIPGLYNSSPNQFLNKNCIVAGMIDYALSCRDGNVYADLDEGLDGFIADFMPMSDDWVTHLKNDIADFDDFKKENADLIDDLKDIHAKMTDGGIWSDLTLISFLYFMEEVGYQHTTAYLKYFFGSDLDNVQTIFSSALVVVKDLSGEQKEMVMADAKANGLEFIGDTRMYLDNAQSFMKCKDFPSNPKFN